MNINTLIYAACLISGLSSPLLQAAQSEADLQAMFDRAITTRESGNTFEAIKLFETILDNQPTLNRVRLELAVAYHQATNYEAALREFKRVLDDPATPENVRLSILAYLGQLSSDAQEPVSRHSFSYYTNLAALHNSNINATPGAGLSPVTGITNASKISSAGSSIDLSASHRYRLKAPLDVLGSATYFEWQSQAGLSSTLYSKTSDYDYNVISLNTGPAMIAPGRWRANIGLRADQILLGGQQLALFTSINPAITFDFGHYRNFTLEGGYTRHRYDKLADRSRDGSETMYGAGYNSLIYSNQAGFELGFRHRQNTADNSGYGYDDRELYLSAFYLLSEQATLYLRSNHHDYDYAGLDPAVNIERDESETQYAIGYNRDLRNGLLKDWTFNLEFSALVNNSNVADFDYRRSLFSTGLSRYFQ